MIKKIFIKYIYKQIKILNSSHQIFKYSFESKKLVALVSLVSHRGKWPRSIVLQLNILSTIQKRIALCCPISICRDTSLIFLLARLPLLTTPTSLLQISLFLPRSFNRAIKLHLSRGRRTTAWRFTAERIYPVFYIR